MYFDTPRDYVSSVYDELLFGDNPLGWETLGTKETVTGATRETFLDYLSSWYRPASHGRRRRRDDRRRPAAPARGAARRHRAERHRQARPGRGRALRRAAGAHPRARTPTRRTSASASPSYPLDHPDRYALQLLGTVLGTGMSSRLFLEVRERRGLAYYVYALNSSFTDAGTLVSQAGVDLKRADEAVGVIAHEFKRIARGAGAGRRAREGARARQGPLRAADREPERAAPVRPAPRGARGPARSSRRSCSPASTPSPSTTSTASRRT